MRLSLFLFQVPSAAEPEVRLFLEISVQAVMPEHVLP